MIAKQIKLSSVDQISIKWEDEHDSVVSLRTLRDQCPCAGCKGETVLLRTYEPVKQQDLPGKYSLISIKEIGRYAIQITWKDGHATGIYAWKYLRSLCECRECLDKKTKNLL